MDSKKSCHFHTFADQCDKTKEDEKKAQAKAKKAAKAVAAKVKAAAELIRYQSTEESGEVA
jgi:hypothetical protein